MSLGIGEDQLAFYSFGQGQVQIIFQARIMQNGITVSEYSLYKEKNNIFNKTTDGSVNAFNKELNRMH